MHVGDDNLNDRDKKSYFLNLKRSQMSVSKFASYIWLNHKCDDRLILKWKHGLEVEVIFEEFFDSDNTEPLDSPNYHDIFLTLWKVLEIFRFSDVGINNIDEGSLFVIDDKHVPDFVEDLKGTILWRKSLL